jgi:hypothetical protein
VAEELALPFTSKAGYFRDSYSLSVSRLDQIQSAGGGLGFVRRQGSHLSLQVGKMNQQQIDTAEKIVVTSATWLSKAISFTLKFFFWATMIMIGFLVSVIWGVLNQKQKY